jgi:hypothetical protein
MYRQDITQNVEPAMANPAYLQEAARLSGEASKLRSSSVATLIKAGEQAYKFKIEGDMAQLDKDSDALLNEFMTTNMAAEEAARTLPQVQSIISFEEGVGPMRPEDMDALDSIKAQAQRLKDAMQGGMSNVQYEARVADLSRKAIARYPGMADKIRQVVGATTGLAGAERWAASQFVRERFSPKGDDGAKLIQKDFDMIHGKLGVPYEVISNAYNADPVTYRDLRDKAQELATVEAVNNATEQKLKNMQNQGALTVPELTNTSLGRLEGILAERLMGTYQMAASEGAFNAYIEQVRTGNLNPDELVAASSMHTTRMLRAVEEAHRDVSREALQQAVKMGLTKAQQDEVLAVLDRRLQDEQRLWGDKNAFVAQAIVEQNFANATFDKKFKMMQVSMQLLQFVPAKTIEAYFTNPEVLKSTNPNLYSKIDESVRMADSARGNVLGSIDSSRRNVSFTVEQVGETGEVVVPPNMPVADVKATDEAIGAQVDAAVDRISKGGAVTQQDVNYMKGLFNGSSPRGGNVTLTKGIQRIRGVYQKLDDDGKAEVKAAASQGAVTAVTNINNIVAEIEKQYGVKLEFGVNDNGQIGILPSPSTPLPVDMSVPFANRVDPNWTYTTARNDAVKRLTPMLENLVNTRLIVDDREGRDVKGAIAKEYVDVISSRQPYSGFFSLQPKPTAPAATTTSGIRATMADIVEFATQEGISIEDAENQLRARGVTID